SEIFVYDLDYNFVSYYSIPSTCSDAEYYILGNGNVFVQYAKELPDDATEYDVYAEGTKYDVNSLIFDVVNSTTKEMNLNFVVSDLISKAMYPEIFEEYVTSSKIVNLAQIHYIVDKSINENDKKVVSLSDDMVILGTLGKEISNQDGIAEPIGNNRFIVSDKSGRDYLINERGEMIGEVSAANYDDYSGYF
ncbi:MAG: hypothetical protein IKZ28_01250, partial [Clostridia bacterium]|nr:hypothetical protein [Clostridia bacterium]